MRRRVRLVAAMICFLVSLGALGMAAWFAAEITAEYGHNLDLMGNVSQVGLILGAALFLVSLPAGLLGIFLWRSARRETT